MELRKMSRLASAASRSLVIQLLRIVSSVLFISTLGIDLGQKETGSHLSTAKERAHDWIFQENLLLSGCWVAVPNEHILQPSSRAVQLSRRIRRHLLVEAGSGEPLKLSRNL